MSLFSLVKHTTTVVKHARTLSTSMSSASGGWGRSSVTANYNVKHNYSMYVNFGVPRDYSGNISILFDCDKPILESSSITTIKPFCANDEIKNIKDAPVSYYTYS